MNINITEREDHIIIAPNEDIEFKTMKAFRTALLDATNKYKKDMIINLENVNYIDSSGLGILITISKLQKSNNKTMILKNVNVRIARVIELSSLNEFMESPPEI